MSFESLSLKRKLAYIRSAFSKLAPSHNLRNALIWSVVFVLFLSLTGLTQWIYDSNHYTKVNVSSFEHILQKKEKFARQTLQKITSALEQTGIESLYENTKLYEESESHEVSFHIYRGEELLFWTDNDVALRGVKDFDYSNAFFYEAENASVVVLQSFFREYRCVALIKIKSIVVPKKNSEENYFAKDFGLTGTVLVQGPSEVRGSLIRLSDDTPIMTITDGLIYTRAPISAILTVLFFLIAMYALFVFAYSGLKIAKNYCTKGSFHLFFAAVVVVLIVLMSLCSYWRFPDCFFNNDFLQNMSFVSSWAPTISHLYLYTFFNWGILFLLTRFYPPKIIRIPANNPKSWAVIAVAKLGPFILLFVLFWMIHEVVYLSSFNVAVPYIREVSAETYMMLMLMLSWIYLFYCFVQIVRVIYAEKQYTYQVLWIHLLYTLIAIVFCVSYSLWVELIFVFLVSILILYLDLYETYYPVSTFLYTVPSAFVLINMLVALSYKYSSMANDYAYHMMASETAARHCVYEDELAESVLQDRSGQIRGDLHLSRMIEDLTDEKKDAFRWLDQDSIQSYLWDNYFKSFEDKYELELQVCLPYDSLHVRKTNYDVLSCLNFVYLSNRFHRVGDSRFYANDDESLAVSYLGVFPFGPKNLYLKIYRTIAYDQVSFLEQSRRMSRPSANLSRAKYVDGDLVYSEGDYPYPVWYDWKSEERTLLPSNSHTHYYEYSPNGHVMSVVSVPVQKSYIYMILLTYLFAFYVVVALLAFSERNLRNRQNVKSVLNRMQLIFIAPMTVAFFVLAVATFPFFTDQIEKSQFVEIRKKSLAVQQTLQRLLEQTEDIKDVQPALIIPQVKQLSNLFATDILLYDKEGRLRYSSRPLFLSNEKREVSLVHPRIRFSGLEEYQFVENERSVGRYALYKKVYNAKNECAGYVHLLSDQSYSESHNETYNILVVVVDIYIFIVIISIFIIWLLNRYTTRPLRLLTQRFAEIQLTGENIPIEYKEEDEIGDLVNRYNQMVAQLEESAAQLARSEREFAWREMARRIAHEIKNPLTPMKLSVQQCLRKREIDPENFDEYFKKTSRILIEQIDNLSNIASEFSSFAKAAEARCSKMNIVEKLRSAVALFENNTEDVYFTLNLNGYEEEFVWMDERQVLQIFNNLFRNAIQAIPDGREGEVKVSFTTEDAFAIIAIKDNGCGISEENRENMFKPNFTTKTSGMGLGLAIVKNILVSSCGDIWFDTVLDEGTCFYVKIPLYKS